MAKLKVLKYLLSVLIVLFISGPVSAQENKSRKEIREERQAKRIEEVKKMIQDTSFVFSPSNAQPMTGGTIQLDFYFSARVKGDSIYSYLPFFGVAYHVEYGSRTSPLSFELPLHNYELTVEAEHYNIRFEVKNKNDHIRFNFQISKLGFASLAINSTHRQSISYYGRIEKEEE